MTIANSGLRNTIQDWLSGFGRPVRITILAASVVVGAFVLFWLFNQTFYYLVAKSYSDELSQAYNINKGYTKALLWASFAAVVLFSGCIFSFSKRKRLLGTIGILALLIGHGVLMGMRDNNYDISGNTERCYVLTRNGIKLLNHVGIDACVKAVRQFPNEPRYQYQLGRAAQFKDKKKAFELFTSLTNAKYPSAFDNLGGMYAEKNDVGTDHSSRYVPHGTFFGFIATAHPAAV